MMTVYLDAFPVLLHLSLTLQAMAQQLATEQALRKQDAAAFESNMRAMEGALSASQVSPCPFPPRLVWLMVGLGPHDCSTLTMHSKYQSSIVGLEVGCRVRLNGQAFTSALSGQAFAGTLISSQEMVWELYQSEHTLLFDVSRCMTASAFFQSSYPKDEHHLQSCPLLYYYVQEQIARRSAALMEGKAAALVKMMGELDGSMGERDEEMR